MQSVYLLQGAQSTTTKRTQTHTQAQALFFHITWSCSSTSMTPMPPIRRRLPLVTSTWCGPTQRHARPQACTVRSADASCAKKDQSKASGTGSGVCWCAHCGLTVNLPYERGREGDKRGQFNASTVIAHASQKS